MLSLAQMAKTSAAIAKLSAKGIPYISVLTHPTTGGVTASFPALADVIIAEPGALIGFTGARVIEQTLKEKLPEGFQTAEFMLEHGMVDMVADRNTIKGEIAKLLDLFGMSGTAAVSAAPISVGDIVPGADVARKITKNIKTQAKKLQGKQGES
jgi:acetyl-CoA carboxylase carboxyl transferase subunit beta